MNVTEFPHNGDNVQYEGKWIFPIICMFTNSSLSFIRSFLFLYRGTYLTDLPSPRIPWGNNHLHLGCVQF